MRNPPLKTLIKLMAQ